MRYLLIVLFLIGGLSVFSQSDCLPALPKKSEGLVHQFNGARMLSAAEEARLEAKLLAKDKASSVQVVVVVHDDLCKMAAWQFAAKIGEKWGVGQSDTDNGIVIALKPKTAGSKGEVWISSGRGVLQYLDAVMAGRIVDRIMIPRFRQGDIYGGIDEATNAIYEIAAGNYDPVEDYDGGDEVPPLVVILIFIFFLFIIIWISSKAEGNVTTYSGRGWTTRRNTWSGGGGFGGFGSGSGSGGGSFGGFGGGSFGGGGAGGSW